MYKNILIATDGSEVAGRGLDHGLALAKALGAKVTIVTVTENWSALEMAEEARRLGTPKNVIQDYESAMAKGAKSVLDAANAVATKQGIAAATIHVPDQPPATGIVATAEKLGNDLIVMGSHGRRGLGRLILGSQANEVVTTSRVPVLVVR